MDKADRVGSAVAAILLAVLALSLGDALVKDAIAETPLWLIFLVRSALALPVLGAVCVLTDAPLSVRAPGLVGLRCLCLVAMWVAYYAALARIELATAAAAYYTIPIFIVLLTAAVARQRVQPWAWVAVGLGFCGILLILRPGTSGLGLVMVLPLLAAALYAVAMVLTRVKLADEAPATLTLWLNASFVIAGLAGWTVAGFEPMGLSVGDLGIFGIMAAALIVGAMASAFAYQRAPGPVVGTFDYGYLCFSIFWGWVFFAETPDGPAWIGIGLIASAGLLVLWTNAPREGAKP